MKHAKKFLPLLLTCASHVAFGQNIGATQENARRDSIIHAVIKRVADDLKKANTVQIDSVIKFVAPPSLKEKNEYRFWMQQGDAGLAPDFFDLREEVKNNKGKKRGFIYTTIYAAYPRTCFLSMEKAEKLIMDVDQMSGKSGTVKQGIYFHFNAYPYMTLYSKEHIQDEILKGKPSPYETAIVVDSRFAETMDNTVWLFASTHEEMHNIYHLDSTHEAQLKSEPLEMQNRIQRYLEYACNAEAARIIGYEQAQRALDVSYGMMNGHDYDKEPVKTKLNNFHSWQNRYATHMEFDHPVIAEHKYCLYIFAMFDNNKELGPIIESLLPEDAQLYWRGRDANKPSYK